MGERRKRLGRRFVPAYVGTEHRNKSLVGFSYCSESRFDPAYRQGMPAEWIESGKKTVIRDYPLNGGRKIGFSLVSSNDTVTLTLTGDGAGTCEAILDLIGLRGNIESASCEYDSERGVVIIPKGVTQVTVRRKI